MKYLSGGGEGTKYLFGGGEGTIRARSLLTCANARTRPTYVCSPVAARSLNHSFGSMKIETETANVCVDEKMHAGSATVDTLFFAPRRVILSLDEGWSSLVPRVKVSCPFFPPAGRFETSHTHQDNTASRPHRSRTLVGKTPRQTVGG